MKRLTLRRALRLVAGAALVVAAPACAAASKNRAAASASADQGQYVVTGVLIDPALDNLQRRWFRDDPRLIGRFVTIEPRRLAIDTGRTCAKASRRVTQRSIADVLRANSQRRNAAAARAPGAADFGLSPVAAGRVAVVEYRCADADGPGRDWSGATGFALGGGQRALTWDREVVLVLQPLSGAARVQPSFACAKARSASERAICADASLAAWDRSVAGAFKLNRDGGGPDAWEPAEDQAALAESQRNWLKKRDACAADRMCLLDAMYARTDALMRRQID